MLSSDRRKVLTALGATLVVSGCGFTPAYAPGADGTSLRNQILPDEPDNGLEFNFVKRFEDRLGRAEAAPYQLTYSISTRQQRLAITADRDTQRYNLVGELTYRIQDAATGNILTSGQLESFTSFSALGTTVSTRASENDARERLTVILADQLVTRLLATSGTWLP